MSLTKIRLREAWNWGGLTARELGLRTWHAMEQHDTLNQAAVVAFYAMLSLVPLLSLALALGAAAGVVAEVQHFSHQLLPPEADAIVRDQVRAIEASRPTGLLSLSIVLLLWSASSLFVAVMDTTNAAYAVRDERPWWKKRLMAIVLTAAEAVLLVGASASIMIWPDVGTGCTWTGRGKRRRRSFSGWLWWRHVGGLPPGLLLRPPHQPDVGVDHARAASAS